MFCKKNLDKNKPRNLPITSSPANKISEIDTYRDEKILIKDSKDFDIMV